MAQGSNHTRTTRPKPRDGTQDQTNPERSDANWYGASKEPQEEFIENDPQASRVEGEARDRSAKTSEGKPTFSRGNETSAPDTHELSPEGSNSNGSKSNSSSVDDPTRMPDKTPVEGP